MLARNIFTGSLKGGWRKKTKRWCKSSIFPFPNGVPDTHHLNQNVFSEEYFKKRFKR
jgi:hypothetical protein